MAQLMIAAFLVNLFDWDIKPIAGTGNWITETELVFFSRVLGKKITVPVGYKTDLASIPKLLRWFMHPTSEHIRIASVVHDYCYTNLCLQMSKKQADQVLREAMRLMICPAPAWKIAVVYCAVRIGGRGNW